MSQASSAVILHAQLHMITAFTLCAGPYNDYVSVHAIIVMPMCFSMC